MPDQTPSMPPLPVLAKADTVALWHAVNWMQTVLTEWRRDGLKDEEDREKHAVESERLLQAKRALRKVNAIRKAMTPVSTPSLERKDADHG